VQKSNDQVRVNVQLINALTDAHLWADTYDRKLTDMFAVESEIAKTIAETLQARLTGSEKTAISKKPTENPEAHELYLKGRFFWNKAPRTICGNRSTTSIKRSKRIRTMPRRMPVSRNRGSCSRLSMEARRKIVFRKPRLRRRKRSHWMTRRPVPMLLWPRSRDLTDSIIPAHQ
jgi:Predicted integral membrane protein